MDLTPKFERFLDNARPNSPPTISCPHSPTHAVPDDACKEIVALLTGCLVRLDRLTPQCVRDGSNSRLRPWVLGLVKCFDLLPAFKRPTFRDLNGEPLGEIATLKSTLRTAKDCIEALEVQFRTALGELSKGGGWLKRSAPRASLLDQRLRIIDILTAFHQDITEAVQRFEARTLSWQVASYDIFDPKNAEQILLTLGDPAVMKERVAEMYIRRRQLRVQSLREEWDMTMRTQLDDNNPEVSRLVELALEAPCRPKEEERTFKDDLKPISEPSTAANSKINISLTFPPPMDEEFEQTAHFGGALAPLAAEVLQIQEEAQDDEADAARDIADKVERISDLMTMFASKVYEQREITENIMLHSGTAVMSLRDANLELLKSMTNKWTYRSYLFVSYLGLGLIVLFLDLITSWRLI